MRQNRDRLVLLLALAALSFRAEAQRQPARPEMIPLVVVNSAPTMGSIFGDTIRFAVGRLPDGWPSALAPGRAAKVVGGSTLGPFRSMVVSYPRTADAIAAYGRIAAAAGFRPYDSTTAPPEGGFAAMLPTSMLIAAGSSVWCDSAHTMLGMSTVDSTSTTRRFAVLLFGGKGVSSKACGASSLQDFPRIGAGPTLKVPPLRAPAGARISNDGMSSSGDSFTLRAVADTALSAAALVEHYGAELERGGWKRRGAPAHSAGASVIPVSARDASGAEWQGALVIVTVGSHRTMNLVMSKVDVTMGPFD